MLFTKRSFLQNQVLKEKMSLSMSIALYLQERKMQMRLLKEASISFLLVLRNLS